MFVFFQEVTFLRPGDSLIESQSHRAAVVGVVVDPHNPTVICFGLFEGFQDDVVGIDGDERMRSRQVPGVGRLLPHQDRAVEL